MNNLVPVAVLYAEFTIRLHMVPTGLSEEELTKHIFSIYINEGFLTRFNLPGEKSSDIVDNAGQVIPTDELLAACMQEYQFFRSCKTKRAVYGVQRWFVSYDQKMNVYQCIHYDNIISDVCDNHGWMLSCDPRLEPSELDAFLGSEIRA